MQSFDLSLVLFQIFLFLPIAISLVLWLQFQTGTERAFWMLPRRAALPRHSTVLLTAGCLLIFGAVIVETSLRPQILSRYAPPVPKSAEEFSVERELVKTQFAVVVNRAMAAIALLIIVLLPREERQRVGFRSDDLPRQATDGLYGFLLCIVPVYALVLIVHMLRYYKILPETESGHVLLQMITEGDLQYRYVFWACLLAILVAPLQEELLYRVLLQEGLVSMGYRLRVAIPSVALFFAVRHGFPNMIPIFPLALLLGVTLHFRNSFLAVVLMHMLFNTFNIVLTIVGTLQQ